MAAFKESKITISGKVYTLRELSVRQRKAVLDTFNKDQDPIEMSVQLVGFSCNRFNENDLDEILDLPASLFNALSTAAADVSGLGPDDDEEKKD